MQTWLKRIIPLRAWLSVLILLAGCAAPAAQPNPTLPPTALPQATPMATPSAAARSLTDSRGQSLTLNAPAQRIVSLAPSSTEVLFAIGAGAQVVGRDTFSDYPEAAKAVADIGGGFGELNLEVILAAKPDLVLASSLTPPEQIQALEEAGLKVFALSNPKDYEGMYANLTTVAQLTGHETETAALIDGLMQRVAAVEVKLAGLSQRPLVFYEIDGTDPNAVWTPGPGSFVDNLIRMAGGDNLGAKLDSEWAQVNLEELIVRQPELILLGDAQWGGVTVEAVRARAGWDALKAIQTGQVFPFDDNLVSRPGPRLVDGLEAMARLLHPELFK